MSSEARAGAAGTGNAAAPSASTAAGVQSASSSSTFLESEPVYSSSRRNRDDSDDEQEDDDDDDEKLFAELDAELDMMEDESNFDFRREAGGLQAEERDGRDTVAGFDMAEFRERRMEELRQEIAARTANPDTDALQYTSTSSMKGMLTDISQEKDLIQYSSRESRVAIHFYHPKFQRCALLDRHLTVLARLHPTTLFLKANVLSTPFLVQKLKISVLPCLVTFKDGISKDKIVGFEELGNSDKFSTGALEWRLGQSGIIDPRENQKPILGFADSASSDTVGKGVVGRKQDEQDDFWDDE